MGRTATAEREAPKVDQTDLIGKFESNYAAAMVNARVSMEHTDTEGWQRLYSGHMDVLRNNRQHLAKKLHVMADEMERHGLTEDGDKMLGEIKKASTELRGQQQVFEMQTVQPVRDPVEECERIVSAFRGEARSREQEAPLVNRGLVDSMRVVTDGVEKPKWDAETGRVSIEQP